MGKLKKTGIFGVIAVILYIAVYLFAPELLVNDVEQTQALVNFDEDFQIHFIDQTTPNMIQGLKGVFARKPLISRGI